MCMSANWDPADQRRHRGQVGFAGDLLLSKVTIAPTVAPISISTIMRPAMKVARSVVSNWLGKATGFAMKEIAPAASPHRCHRGRRRRDSPQRMPPNNIHPACHNKPSRSVGTFVQIKTKCRPRSTHCNNAYSAKNDATDTVSVATFGFRRSLGIRQVNRYPLAGA